LDAACICPLVHDEQDLHDLRVHPIRIVLSNCLLLQYGEQFFEALLVGVMLSEMVAGF
jgi:hypothetical protein